MASRIRRKGGLEGSSRKLRDSRSGGGAAGGVGGAGGAGGAGPVLRGGSGAALPLPQPGQQRATPGRCKRLPAPVAERSSQRRGGTAGSPGADSKQRPGRLGRRPDARSGSGFSAHWPCHLDCFLGPALGLSVAGGNWCREIFVALAILTAKT